MLMWFYTEDAAFNWIQSHGSLHHYRGKRAITGWLCDKAPKAVTRDVLLSLPTLAGKPLLKAAKGLRRAVELYNRGGYRQCVATKNSAMTRPVFSSANGTTSHA
jgi:hypothetical protein